VEEKENETYVGPTVIDFVKPEMSVATEERAGYQHYANQYS